ncbi:restriction endonuclease [Nocardia sp. NPDC003183]
MKYIVTAHEAEENAAVQMCSLGFSDARVTASGADGGIDVRASGAIAQVKWRAGQVGRPELQRLFGARGKRFELQLFFFAASPYSAHAVSYANEVDMALYMYDPTGRITAVNPVARRIAARASAPAVDAPSRPASEKRLQASAAASRQREQAAQRKADLAKAREQSKGARSTEIRPKASAAASRQREQAAQKKADLAKARERWTGARSTNLAAHLTGNSEIDSSNRLLPAKPYVVQVRRSREQQQAQAVQKMLALADTRRRMQAAVAANRSSMTATNNTDKGPSQPARRYAHHLVLSIVFAGVASVFGTAVFAEQVRADSSARATFVVLAVMFTVIAWRHFSKYRSANQRGREWSLDRSGLC